MLICEGVGEKGKGINVASIRRESTNRRKTLQPERQALRELQYGRDETTAIQSFVKFTFICSF